VAAGLAFQGSTLYTVDQNSDKLRTVDLNQGSIGETLTEITITGVNGAAALAADPDDTSKLWAVLVISGPDRVLAKIDLTTIDFNNYTVIATQVGMPLTAKINGIAFVEDDPVNLITVLIGDVIALNLQNGISNALDAKLDAALSSLDDLNDNNNVAACGSLNAFINFVEAQSGNMISEAAATQLISAAQHILALLECP